MKTTYAILVVCSFALVAAAANAGDTGYVPADQNCASPPPVQLSQKYEFSCRSVDIHLNGRQGPDWGSGGGNHRLTMNMVPPDDNDLKLRPWRYCGYQLSNTASPGKLSRLEVGREANRVGWIGSTACPDAEVNEHISVRWVRKKKALSQDFDCGAAPWLDPAKGGRAAGIDTYASSDQCKIAPPDTRHHPN